MGSPKGALKVQDNARNGAEQEDDEPRDFYETEGHEGQGASEEAEEG